jgi:hypothetical protein
MYATLFAICCPLPFAVHCHLPSSAYEKKEKEKEN